MNFEKLLSPLTIGTMQVKNRCVMSPMGSDLALPDGRLNDRYIDYMVARAKGGFGLVEMEVTSIDEQGYCIPNEPGIWDDKFIPGLKTLADAVHQYGAKIAAQLHHAGREAIAPDVRAIAPSPLKSLAPSASIVPTNTPREMTVAEIWDLIEKFGDGALRAKRAGIDAVEIHGAHQYLIAQFMSGYANKRTDEFGGSLANRMRFPLEVVKNIRRKAGEDYPIIFRLSSDERVYGGRTVEGSKLVARLLQDAGVNAISVSVGTAPSAIAIVAPPSYPPGHLLEDAAAIRSAVSIPVIAVGRVHDPYLAELALERNMADLISFGRQCLADPETPNKIAEGRYDEICPCISCLQGCIGQLLDPEKGWASCLTNPFAGREYKWKIEPAKQRKKVVVAGAGPAGLEAAWVAAARGHDVTVYEKSGRIGGQFTIACVPPCKQEIAAVVNYWRTMCEKYRVKIILNQEATAEVLLREKPEAVVLATGAEPIKLPLAGTDGEKVAMSWDVLSGQTAPGIKALVIGGGEVGCEVADYLALQGHEVTIVEMRSTLAPDMDPWPRQALLERLDAYGLQRQMNSKVTRLTADGAVVEQNGQAVELSGFDSIILASGSQPVNPLEAELRGQVAELYVVGDATKARKALEAIAEGAEIGLKL